ncbi:GNAT family N-acetyltransferase (plasmid) [Streptomyces sp. R39]|uniref:GNAT family N-acetyltransferase n=1 Tax=Streptomyces sp. R39 TaxID=3238631 RepID=A0AB39R613_9ACTN
MAVTLAPTHPGSPHTITETGAAAAPTVQRHAAAAEFSAELWDRLVDPDSGLYSSHRWIRALEMTHGPQPVLAARVGRLTGVLPTWTTQEGDAGDLFDPPAMTHGLIDVPGRRALWLGTRRSTAATITCTPGPQRPLTLAALLEEARKTAADQHLSCAVWPYLTGDQALEAAACHPLAQAVLHTADAWVDVPPDGVAGLQAAARSKDRRKWRREREQFTEHGGMEWTGLTPDTCSRIAPLLAATRRKYGAPGGTRLMHRILAAQRAAGVADHAVVALARRRGESAVRAAAVFYRHGTTLYGRYWGTDAAAPPNSYFELTLYSALDRAARIGMRRLHLSVPAAPAKLFRGARAAPLALVYLPADPGASLDPGIIQRHNHRTAQPWSSAPHYADRSWGRWVSPPGA